MGVLRIAAAVARATAPRIARVNRSPYVATVRAGGGLKALRDVVPTEFTKTTTCDSFCGSCSLLIDEFEKCTTLPLVS
jgi:aerobic-type carbon monoxide dehydrogenase small subunit (CoxS/CutS family)